MKKETSFFFSFNYSKDAQKDEGLPGTSGKGTNHQRFEIGTPAE